MSLINDALKRAKQSHPGNAPAANVPMQPANQRQAAVGLPVYFIPVLLATVCGAGLFLWNGWENKPQPSLARAPVVVQAREVGESPDSDLTTAADTEEPGIPIGRNFSLENDPPRPALPGASGTPQPSASLHEESTRAAVPAFKLQSIFYRTANPSAVINTKTVFIGDRVANGRVKAISRETVTLDCDGETKVLTFH